MVNWSICIGKLLSHFFIQSILLDAFEYCGKTLQQQTIDSKILKFILHCTTINASIDSE